MRWGKVPVEIYADPALTMTDHSVFGVIAGHANWPRGGLAEVALDTIATVLRRSRLVVERSLRRLLRSGWLEAAEVGWQVILERPEMVEPTTKNGRDSAPAPLIENRGTTEQTPQPAAETPADRPFQEAEAGVHDAKMTANRRTPPPDQPALLPTEAEAPKPTAQHLVAAWVDGYRQTFGEEPQPAMMKRVAGQCGRLGKTCETVEHWRRAWRACRVAGTKNRPDAVPFLAADNPPSLYSTRQGVGTMVRSLAQRRADLLAEQQAQIEQVTR